MKVKVKNLTVNYKNNITKPSAIGDYLDIDGTKVYRYNIDKVEKKVQTDENGEFKYTYLIHVSKYNAIYVYTEPKNKSGEFVTFLGNKFHFDDITNYNKLSKGKSSQKSSDIGCGIIAGGFFLLMMIIFIVSLAIIGSSSGSSSSRENKAREMEERKEAKCRAKSDDYNKCSYSVWEGRCVCKRR